MEILSVAKAQTWRQRSRQPSACAASPAPGPCILGLIAHAFPW